MKYLRLLPLATAVAAAAWAQPLAYTISTVAGGSTAYDFAEGKPATTILLPGFPSPAADKQGNLYFSLGHRVVRVAADGTTKTFAGTGLAGFAGDGAAATAALLNGPGTVVFDPQGRLVIFDLGNKRIRRVELNGTIATIAGNGQTPPGASDGEGGLATAARIGMISTSGGIYDSSGNLFFLDFPGDNQSYLRRIGTDNKITTVVKGAGVYPIGMATDGTNVYVGDVNPAVNRVSRLTTAGTLVAITGSKAGFAGDGSAAIGASFSFIDGIAVDSQGNLHIVDAGNQRIRTVRNNPAGAVASGQGIINTSAGTGTAGFGTENAPALSSPLSTPQTITVDASDNIIFSDNGSGRYRRYKLNGALTTVAGLSLTDPLGDAGPATQAALVAPSAVFRDTAGNLLICDGARLRKVTTDGDISTIAGRGVSGNSGENGPAVQALLTGPAASVEDSAGNVFFLDGAVLWKIAPDGTLTRVIGFAGATGDEGPAATIALAAPFSLAIDAQGNIYIGSQYAVRKMTPAGVVTRVAGTNLFTQVNLASGNARSTSVTGARGLALDADGNLYVADTFAQRIIKVTPAGQFTTVAGAFGKSGFSGDGGPAVQALLYLPSGLAVDPWGNLYVADAFNNRVRKIAPDGTISTIAGSANNAVIKDGDPAVNGQVSQPLLLPGLVTDPAGNVLLVDGKRIRLLTGDKLRTAGVLHAATSAAGPVVAGLRIFIRGTELIPPGAASDAIQVLFDGQPASYVSFDGTQITTVVPATVAGQASTAMQVTIRGAATNTLALPVVAARPGILSILNADGTTNGDSAPAMSGSMVLLLVTGDGNADPTAMSVLIGDEPADILDAEPVDGQPGLRAITVQLPDDAADGAAVVLAVGDAQSQAGLTIRVVGAN